MTTIGTTLLKDAIRSEHSMLDSAVRDLTPDQLHWCPPDTKANSIAFTLWHFVRTEDNVVQFVLQNRKPTVWLEGGYNERFGLDRIAQGTGMTTEDAQALRLPSLDDWMAYQQAVWQATGEFLDGIDDDALGQQVNVRPFPEMPMSQAISTIVLTHGHSHLGEICVLRVLQGLPSSQA